MSRPTIYSSAAAILQIVLVAFVWAGGTTGVRARHAQQRAHLGFPGDGRRWPAMAGEAIVARRVWAWATSTRG